jgi:hypothetical protein
MAEKFKKKKDNCISPEHENKVQREKGPLASVEEG